MCQCFTAWLRLCWVWSRAIFVQIGRNRRSIYFHIWCIDTWLTFQQSQTQTRLPVADTFSDWLVILCIFCHQLGRGDNMDWCRILGMCLLSISSNILCDTSDTWVMKSDISSPLPLLAPPTKIRINSGDVVVPFIRGGGGRGGAMIPLSHFNTFRIHFLLISSKFVALNNSKNFSLSLSSLVSPGASQNFRLVAMTSNFWGNIIGNNNQRKLFIFQFRHLTANIVKQRRNDNGRMFSSCRFSSRVSLLPTPSPPSSTCSAGRKLNDWNARFVVHSNE